VKLRTKLLLAQAPLVLALVVSGAAGSVIAITLGRGSQDILKDNYRSVLAAERMKENLERLDRSALLIVAQKPLPVDAPASKLLERFERELRTQQGNITETGESAATASLRAHWQEYRQQFERLAAAPDAARSELYFDPLFTAFGRVERALDQIRGLNQDAMVQKSDRVARVSQQLNRVLVAVAVLGCLLGLWGSAGLTMRLLRPLSVLSLVARRIGEGDLEARAVVMGGDEIAEVAREFNLMAERVKAYRESSLGELLEAQQSSQAAIDSLPDPVLVLSLDRQLVHKNLAAETVLKLSDEGRRDPIASLDSRLRAVIERVHAQVLRGKGGRFQPGIDETVRIATPDGDRSFLPRASPVYSEQGDVMGTTIVLQDITRQLRIDELKNDLVATVAHEFRTPLTSLRMALHLLIEQAVGTLTDKQSELLHAAREDAERLQATVDELLDLSRIQAGRLSLRVAELDVDALVRSSLDAQRANADERQVAMESRIFPGLGEVSADPDRVRLVFSNLLANAIRYSPAGTTVTVRASRARSQIRFEVCDQGPGIPPEYQQAIFEKYFQIPGGRHGDAGLGLFIAREIVHAHGGELGVSSQPGQGSTFWFTLPIAECHPDAGV